GAGSVLAGLLPFDTGRNDLDIQVAGYTAMSTAVDVEACVRALQRLVDDPALRAEMGAAGQRRVRELYDWPGIIARYDDLYDELAAVRARAEESARPGAGCRVGPLAEDPYRRFGAYATRALAPSDVIAAGATAPRDIEGLAIVSWGSEARVDEEDAERILARVREAGALSAGELGLAFPDLDAEALARTLVHLVKMDVVRLMGR